MKTLGWENVFKWDISEAVQLYVAKGFDHYDLMDVVVDLAFVSMRKLPHDIRIITFTSSELGGLAAAKNEILERSDFRINSHNRVLVIMRYGKSHVIASKVGDAETTAIYLKDEELRFVLEKIPECIRLRDSCLPGLKQ